MKLHVRVTPRAKRRAIEQAPDGTLLVKVTEPAEDGRANAAVIAAVAAHFGVPKRRVTIIRGLTSRQKQIDIIQEG